MRPGLWPGPELALEQAPGGFALVLDCLPDGEQLLQYSLVLGISVAQAAMGAQGLKGVSKSAANHGETLMLQKDMLLR